MKQIAAILLFAIMMCGCSAPRQAHGNRAPVISIFAGGVGQSRVGQDYVDAVCAAGDARFMPLFEWLVKESLK